MGELQPGDRSLLASRWTRVERRRVIQAPPERVWATIADAATWLQWYRPLSRFEVLDADRLGPGVTVAETEWVWKTTAQVVDWDEGARIGTAMLTINAPWLLSRYYRSIELKPADSDPGATEVLVVGGFRFGWVGWLFVAYTYPQLTVSLLLEFRSALQGLADLVEAAEAPGAG